MSAPRNAGWRFVVAALSLLGLVHPAYPQTCDAPFVTGSSEDPTGGIEPREVAVADFTHDGFPDLAVQELASDTVSIMRGSGVGFSLLTTLPFSSTADVAAGDFDHNGWPDIVVSAVDNNEVAVARSNGAGGFLPEDTFGVGAGPTALAIGDFDSDGNLDIAVYNSADLTISILLGDGAGGFANQLVFAMSVGGEMAVGDLDRDGDLDLVATQETADGIVVALGKDDGTFVVQTAIPGTGDGPISLVVSDFNHDGRLDVVTDNSNSGDIEYYRGDGLSGFSPSGRTNANGTVAAHIAAGDVNGDGNLDVVLSDKGSTAIDVFYGGIGAFTTPITEFASFETFGIAAEDFNRDGRDDIAVAYIRRSRGRLLRNRRAVFRRAERSRVRGIGRRCHLRGGVSVSLKRSTRGARRLLLSRSRGRG